MTPIVPRIAIFSTSKIQSTFQTSHTESWFAKLFEVHYYNYDIPLWMLKKLGISLIIVVGNRQPFFNVSTTSIATLFVEDSHNLTGDLIYECYASQSLSDYNPTISIFTPTYNTFDKFFRAYNSVVKQSFQNWEWIIYDDSPNEKNFNFINDVVKNDPRIKLYKSNYRDGFVGSTKRKAASLCNGTYLLELDHDDELHHMALEYVVDAFNKFPDAGFCYSDSCEVYENGGNVNYGNNFAMGYGKHYSFAYKGRGLLGASVPVNASTIRHIVGVPNHLRCWKKDFYFALQRHNNKLSIVDDYELLVRTFLFTRMIHIPETLYIQYMNNGGNNTQEPRRAEIQRLVDKIQKHYDTLIHQRIVELNGEDWLWDDNEQKANLLKPKNEERKSLAYVYKI